MTFSCLASAKCGARCLLVTGIVFSLAACASPTSYDQTGQKQAQGNQIGTIVGSVVGGYIPGGGSVAGQVLQSHAGTIGGLVGGAIGASLDEEDRQALARATRAALESGQRKTFSNSRTGVRGSATVTASTKGTSGQPCRTVKQEAVLPDGKVLSNIVSACKGANDWDV
jgi:surface antigen